MMIYISICVMPIQWLTYLLVRAPNTVKWMIYWESCKIAGRRNSTSSSITAEAVTRMTSLWVVVVLAMLTTFWKCNFQRVDSDVGDSSDT
jgi:hypothetical protein